MKKKPTVVLSTEPRLRPKDVPDPVIARVRLYPLEAAMDRSGLYGEPLSLEVSTLDQSKMPLDARFRDNSPARARRY